MLHVQLNDASDFNMSIMRKLTGTEGTNNFPTSGRCNP